MSAIIFDFDGTIADTIDYFKEYLIREAKLPPLSTEEQHKIKGLTLFAMARSLGHPWWRLSRLYFQGRAQLGPLITKIQPFPGMPEVIQKLHAEGHELFIVSSNSVRNMREFLRMHQLDSYFVNIYGGAVLFGKRPALRRLLRQQKLEARNSICVGDEVRDVKSARALKLRVIAVGWGYAHPEDLRRAKPTGFAATPNELLTILEEV